MHYFVVLLAPFAIEVELVADYHHPVLLEALSLCFQEAVSFVLGYGLVFCYVAESLQNLVGRGSGSLGLFCVHCYHAPFASQSNIRRMTDHVVIVHALESPSLALTDLRVLLHIALSLVKIYHSWSGIHSW